MDFHQRRRERLRREQTSRNGYFLLWAILGAFLLFCLLVMIPR
jgi:hypothetical protein